MIAFTHEALRLTFYGWCLLLAWLVVRRGWDWRRGKHLSPSYPPVRALEMPAIMVFGVLFLVTQFLLFTKPVAVSFLLLPRSEFTPGELLIPLAARMALCAWLIDLFAYDRRFKLWWLASWAAFSSFLIAMVKLW